MRDGPTNTQTRREVIWTTPGTTAQTPSGISLYGDEGSGASRFAGYDYSNTPSTIKLTTERGLDHGATVDDIQALYPGNTYSRLGSVSEAAIVTDGPIVMVLRDSGGPAYVGVFSAGAGSCFRRNFPVLPPTGSQQSTTTPPNQTSQTPSGGDAPAISTADIYTDGVMVNFELAYTDLQGDATGMGFQGVNGSGWAPESHPFANWGPYGAHEGDGQSGVVSYPFNHLCGQAGQYESDVQAWIFDAASHKSDPITIHMRCTPALVILS